MLTLVRWVFPKLEVLSPRLTNRLFHQLFFTPLRYRAPEKEQECAREAEWFSFESEGKRIQCYRWGEVGKPVVWLMHGWAGRATQFRKFIPPLMAAGYQVVGIDGPAHGKSQGRSTSILGFHAAMLELQKITGTPVATISHSFGGVAVLYAVMNGLAVNRLINIGSPTVSDEIIQTFLRAVNASAQTGENFKKWFLEKYDRPFSDFSGMHFIRQMALKPDILLVHDEDDREVPLLHSLELMKAYPKARLLRTTGLGHNRVLKDDHVIQQTVRFIAD